MIFMALLGQWRSRRRGDSEESNWWLPVSFFGTILFLASCYHAFGEFHYLLFAKQTQGTVVRSFLETQRSRGFRRRRHHHRVVEYTFKDDGTTRKERDWVPISWEAPKGEIAIDYIPGRRSSRVAGNHNYLALIFFAVTTGFLSLTLWKVWQESAEPERPRDDDAPVRRRKKRREPDPWEKIQRS